MVRMFGVHEKPQLVFDSTGNLWESAKRTLTNYPKGTTHVLLLQDDVLICDNFMPAVRQIVDALPDKPITLFSNRVSIENARAAGVHYVQLTKWLMAQTYIMPVSIIDDFIAWAELHIKPSIYFDDNRWAMYFYYHGMKVWATAPSLVEHIGWNATTLRPYNEAFDRNNRMARWYIGIQKSALDIDWHDTRSIEDNEAVTGDFTHYLIP
jgi:hypothetical protein